MTIAAGPVIQWPVPGFDVHQARFFRLNFQPEVNRLTDMDQGFLAGFALGVAARQIEAAHRPTFCALQQPDFGSHVQGPVLI